MPKQELIIVARYLGLGGAERVLSELVAKWIDVYDITFWCLERKELPLQYTLPEGVRIIDSQVSYSAPLPRIRNAIKLTKYLKRHPQAIVIAFVKRAILIVALCSPFIRNRIIFSERNDPRYSPTNRIQRIGRDIIYHVASACVFQTEEDMRYFPKRIRKKGKVISNPISVKMPDRYYGEKRKTFITACRLALQKNLPMMIKAFTLLSNDYPDYLLEIYGEGELRESLQQLICSLQMENRIMLQGFVANIDNIIGQSSVYVCSSNYEGISNSLLEAMALGLPVISTDCSNGTRMLIQDGINGLLVPVGDTEAMYRAMKRIIEEPDFAKRLGDEAYKVRERFDIDKIATEWLDVIEEKM